MKPRDVKRAEAQERQAAYAKLSVREKLAKLEGFRAIRQRKRLGDEQPLDDDRILETLDRAMRAVQHLIDKGEG